MDGSPECPRSALGCYACCITTTVSDAMVPMYAAYEATHGDNSETGTSTETTCSYLLVGCLPCFYFQPCQIAAEVHAETEARKTGLSLL